MHEWNSLYSHLHGSYKRRKSVGKISNKQNPTTLEILPTISPECMSEEPTLAVSANAYLSSSHFLPLSPRSRGPCPIWSPHIGQIIHTAQIKSPFLPLKILSSLLPTGLAVFIHSPSLLFVSFQKGHWLHSLSPSPFHHALAFTNTYASPAGFLSNQLAWLSSAALAPTPSL